MKKRMINCLKGFPATIALTIAFLLSFSGAIAQTVVSGKVSDSKDASAVPGVTVTAKGTKITTQTANDGTYKINVPAGSTVRSLGG